jgi:arginine/lysine/ornithine decarboxylase
LFDAALDLASSVRTRLDQIPGLEVLEKQLLGAEASHDLDRLQVLLDVSATGTSGYQARDWLRQFCHLDVGLADHRRILATLSFADDQSSADRLVDSMTAWRQAAEHFDRPAPIPLPSAEHLQLDTVMLPRDAFFGAVEAVPAQKAAGRIAAEQITPYPPGIPVVVPGERLNEAVIDYLRSGVQAGMMLPDPADRQLDYIRVVE